MRELITRARHSGLACEAPATLLRRFAAMHQNQPAARHRQLLLRPVALICGHIDYRHYPALSLSCVCECRR